MKGMMPVLAAALVLAQGHTARAQSVTETVLFMMFNENASDNARYKKIFQLKEGGLFANEQSTLHIFDKQNNSSLVQRLVVEQKSPCNYLLTNYNRPFGVTEVTTVDFENYTGNISFRVQKMFGDMTTTWARFDGARQCMVSRSNGNYNDTEMRKPGDCRVPEVPLSDLERLKKASAYFTGRFCKGRAF